LTDLKLKTKLAHREAARFWEKIRLARTLDSATILPIALGTLAVGSSRSSLQLAMLKFFTATALYDASPTIVAAQRGFR
jgi:hypothetical protein